MAQQSTLNAAYELNVMAGAETFKLAIPPTSTVAQLRTEILHELREVAAGRSARLIWAGRLLNDNESLAGLSVPSGAFIHVALSDARRGAPPPLPSAPRLSHAPGDMGPPSPEVMQAPGGFDRLAALGLDSEDIAVLRGQFLRDVQREMGPSMPRQEGETEASRLLRMEDAWVRAQLDRPHSDFAANIRPLLARNRRSAVHGSSSSSDSVGGSSGGGDSADGLSTLYGDGSSTAGGAGSTSGSTLGWQPWMNHPAALAAMVNARRSGAGMEQAVREGALAAAAAGVPVPASALAPGGPLGSQSLRYQYGNAQQQQRDADHHHNEDEEDGYDSSPYGAASAPEGTMLSLLGGMALGWLLGFVALFVALQPRAARRFKAGVLLGVALNMAFAMWAADNAQNAAGAAGGSKTGGGGGGTGTGGTVPAAGGGDSPWAGGGGGSGGGAVPLTPVDLGNFR